MKYILQYSLKQNCRVSITVLCLPKICCSLVTRSLKKMELRFRFTCDQIGIFTAWTSTTRRTTTTTTTTTTVNCGDYLTIYEFNDCMKRLWRVVFFQVFITAILGLRFVGMPATVTDCDSLIYSLIRFISPSYAHSIHKITNKIGKTHNNIQRDYRERMR